MVGFFLLQFPFFFNTLFLFIVNTLFCAKSTSLWFLLVLHFLKGNITFKWFLAPINEFLLILLLLLKGSICNFNKNYFVTNSDKKKNIFWQNSISDKNSSLLVRATWHLDNRYDVLWAAFCDLTVFVLFGKVIKWKYLSTNWIL